MLPPSDYFFPLSTFTILFFPFHSRLLVGAPNAESGQPGVERAGAVYKCAAETPGNCELIPFDTKGKKEQEEERKSSWAGEGWRILQDDASEYEWEYFKFYRTVCAR